MAPNEVLSLTQFSARRHQAAVPHVHHEGSGEGLPGASRPGKREVYGSGTVDDGSDELGFCGDLQSGEVREASLDPEMKGRGERGRKTKPPTSGNRLLRSPRLCPFSGRSRIFLRKSSSVPNLQCMCAVIPLGSF